MMRRHRREQVTTYEVNGVTYSRIEDMPPHIRAMFADKDGNGIPDLFEALSKGMAPDGSTVIKTHRRITQTHVPEGNSLSFRSDKIDLSQLADQFATPTTLCCSRCRFDLSEVAAGGHCPSCGMAVAQSIAAHSTMGASSRSVLAKVLREHAFMVLAMIGAIAYLIYRLIF